MCKDEKFTHMCRKHIDETVKVPAHIRAENTARCQWDAAECERSRPYQKMKLTIRLYHLTTNYSILIKELSIVLAFFTV